MKKLNIALLKANFSKIIQEVRFGSEFIITFGKNKEEIAVIIPFEKYKQNFSIELDLLKKKKAKIKINENSKITPEELLCE